MRRYLIASILIGLVSFGIGALLCFSNALDGLNTAMMEFLRNSGLLSAVPVDIRESQIVWLEIGLIAVAAFGVSWCVVNILQPGQTMLIYLLLLIVLAGFAPCCALYGYVFSPFAAMTSASLSLIMGIAYAGTKKGMRMRVLQNILGERVSRETISRLIDHQEALPLKGDSREATVMTCRLLNHSLLESKMEAPDYVALLNRFHRNTSDFLTSRGAYLDESSPDCLRVFFGLLIPDKEHSLQACHVALELKKRLNNLEKECENRWLHKPEFGIALSAGKMTIGVYGSERHYFFSGVGPATDFSRRLSLLNAVYGSTILIDSGTLQFADKSILARPMEMIYDLDKNLMTEVYELLDDDLESKEEIQHARDTFWEAIILYREGEYVEALEKFSRLKNSDEAAEDRPLAYFIEKAQDCLTQNISAKENPQPVMHKGHARNLNTL